MQLIRFLEQNPDGLDQLGKQLNEPFTVPCAAIMELETLLQRAEIPEDTVHRGFEAYLDTLGEQAKWEPPNYKAQPLWDCLFDYLLDPSWMSSGGRHHLIHFIHFLASDDSKQFFALQNWVRNTARSVGIPAPQRSRGPIVRQEKPQSYLLLAVSPEGGY